VLHSHCNVLSLQSVGLQNVEAASRSSRGQFIVMHELGAAAGACLSAFIGLFVADQPPLGWRLMFGMGVLPAAAVLCVVPWLYETPHR
jgi:MFS family permease